MKTRTLRREELSTIGYDYVRAGGRSNALKTAEDLLDGARDSLLGREDVPEIEIEAGDAEIVHRSIAEALYETALRKGGVENEAIVAEGLARGHLEVVNRSSVSPGGLRFAAREDLDWLDPAPDTGCWLLGTGFVARAWDV
jgi:hypothetical protein